MLEKLNRDDTQIIFEHTKIRIVRFVCQDFVPRLHQSISGNIIIRIISNISGAYDVHHQIRPVLLLALKLLNWSFEARCQKFKPPQVSHFLSFNSLEPWIE